MIDSPRRPGDSTAMREDANQCCRDILMTCRRANLVVNDGYLLSLFSQPQHRGDEIATIQPVAPADPQDDMHWPDLSDRGFTVKLTLAIGIERVGLVSFNVRFGFCPIKDKICRDV